jgi:replication factor A1
MPEEKNNLTIEEIANEAKEIMDCTVRGVIIDIKPGSGVMMRCPECKRALYKGQQCRLHGSIKGVPDLRIKAAIDDGTGAMMVVLHKEIAEKIMGRTLEWYQAMIGETANPDAPRHDIMEKLIARPVEVRGRVTIDDYGLLMIATEARVIDVEKEMAEARALAAEEHGTGR